jgi:hypothetical protein
MGLCLALTGCGGGGSVVEGKVVNNGQPYSQATDGEVSITLSTDDKAGAGGTGMVNPDGTFTIKSGKGGGLPAGKYKVSYVAYPKATTTGKGPPPQPRVVNTDEVWDVGSGKTFTLDIGKGGAAGKGKK